MADLFESGVPGGFTFSYLRVDGLKASSGCGTYPAQWKRWGRRWSFWSRSHGKPWNLETRSLQAALRPGLDFLWKNGNIAEESGAVLKGWMVKHQYDAENEKVDPVMLPGESEDSNSPLVDPRQQIRKSRR